MKLTQKINNSSNHLFLLKIIFIIYYNYKMLEYMHNFFIFYIVIKIHIF